MNGETKTDKMEHLVEQTMVLGKAFQDAALSAGSFFDVVANTPSRTAIVAFSDWYLNVAAASANTAGDWQKGQGKQKRRPMWGGVFVKEYRK